MAKNHRLRDMRISDEMDKMLSEASKEMELSKTDVARLLLGRALKQLKSDSIKAGGFSKLQFTFKDI